LANVWATAPFFHNNPVGHPVDKRKYVIHRRVAEFLEIWECCDEILQVIRGVMDAHWRQRLDLVRYFVHNAQQTVTRLQDLHQLGIGVFSNFEQVSARQYLFTPVL